MHSNEQKLKRNHLHFSLISPIRFKTKLRNNVIELNLPNKINFQFTEEMLIDPTETTIFVHTKKSEIQILGYFLRYFHQNRTRERAKCRN